MAFGLGLFGGSGDLGSGHHRAFAVSSESRASDTMLRFHDCCQNYKVHLSTVLWYLDFTSYTDMHTGQSQFVLKLHR